MARIRQLLVRKWVRGFKASTCLPTDPVIPAQAAPAKGELGSCAHWSSRRRSVTHASFHIDDVALTILSGIGEQHEVALRLHSS